MRRVLILAFLVALSCTSGRAQPPAWSLPPAIQDYFAAATARLRDGCLAEINTLEGWNANREEYRRQLREMLGIDPLPERTDLKAVVTRRIERDDFIVENIHFQSSPKLYVTANLYLPKTIEKPCPAILYLCGHGGVKKNNVSYGNKVHYQHHGIWLARHGYACLVVDSLQLGEIEGIHHGTYRYDRWWWNARGYSPAGVEAWNCIRALDYLQSRKEVDGERLGVTGRSGGGAYSWYVAALDERIKAAVPVAGITDLENHVTDGAVEGHCDCMYFVNTYRWDYPQLAALVAPRPLLISNTDKDRIFPLEGVQRTHRIVRGIYKLSDAEKNLGLQITEGDHEDTQELQIHALVWFDRFLGGGRRPIRTPTEAVLMPEDLKVFEKLPTDEINTKIDETFVPAAKDIKPPANKEEWEKLRAGWMKTLREKTFRGWPQEPGDLDVDLKAERVNGVFEITSGTFKSEANLPLTFAVQEKLPVKSLHVVVTDDANSRRAELSDAAAIYITPRGLSDEEKKLDPKKQVQIRRRYMLHGQTLAGMQVWDVRRAIQAIRVSKEYKEAPIVFVAKGDMAVIALYASLFEPNIAEVRLEDLPATHRDGPDLLNVLKSHDIPQALTMAAERGSVHFTAAPGNWEFLRETGHNLGWDKRVRIEVQRKTR